MSRPRIVPPRPTEAGRHSRALPPIAVVLGAAVFVLFDSGRTWLAVGLAIPAAIVGLLAVRHTLRPFVIHMER
jgi:hypothetical protein